MKKIIAFLFFLQLIIGGIIAIMSINGHQIDQLLFAGTTDVTIVFGADNDHFGTFLDKMEENDLIVTRIMFMDPKNLNLYATDVTFNDYVTLSEGRFPAAGSDEFISNIHQNDPNQVGIIGNITPEYNITLRHLEKTQALGIDGRYRIHTVDVDMLNDIREEMLEDVQVFQIYYPMEDDRNLATTVLMGIMAMPTVTTTALVISIPIITFFCIGATLLQFSMSQAKESFTLHVHGYSRWKVIVKSFNKLLTPLLLVGILTYFLFNIYMVITGLSVFSRQFIFVFGLLYVGLLFIYMMIVVVVMYVTFEMLTSHAAIKGYKPDFTIQVLNHGLKLIFLTLFLVGSYYSVMDIITLSAQREHLQGWETAQNVHRLNVSSFLALGSDENDAILHQLEALGITLSETHEGFIMNAERIYSHDNFRNWMQRSPDATPFIIDPSGNRVDITPNYLNLNPIQAVNGIEIEDQLIWEESVLNLLVPVQLAVYEDVIRELYLEAFYFDHLMPKNTDGLINQYTIDDGFIHIIYVENEQSYFTFDTRIRPEEGNCIIDPIAVVITDNFNPIMMGSLMSVGFYIVSDSVNAFSDIEDVVAEYDLSYSLRFVESVFTEHAEQLRLLEQDVLSGFFVLSALFITNLIVNYNLISNYFWRNKHILFTKSLFGFSLWNRHKWFIICFLAYVVPIIALTSVFLGWTVFLMATLFLVLDIIMAMLFEQHLMKKSFSEIMKGER